MNTPRELAQQIDRLMRLHEWSCVMHTTRQRLSRSVAILVALYFTSLLSEPAVRVTLGIWLLTLSLDVALYATRLHCHERIAKQLRERAP